MHSRHILIVLSLVTAMAAAVLVSAGDPDNPRGLAAATDSHTLEDTYHRLNAGAGTMRTINGIMEAAPALDSTNGVNPVQV